MEGNLIVLGLMTLIMVGGLVKYLQNEKTDNCSHQSMQVNTQEGGSMPSNNRVGLVDTRGNMQSILTEIGCQPVSHEDGSLTVQYQGENFHMEFGGMYARIWDPRWAGVKVNDPDLSNIREAVNLANYNFGPTIVMTRPDDDGVISLHSRRDIMLHPACPDNSSFVKDVLDSFFATKEELRNSYKLLSSQQQATEEKKRRPVGFRTQE